jgi:hypothetical protein
MKIVTPYNVVEIYVCVGGIYCIHLQGYLLVFSGGQLFNIHCYCCKYLKSQSGGCFVVESDVIRCQFLAKAILISRRIGKIPF